MPALAMLMAIVAVLLIVRMEQTRSTEQARRADDFVDSIGVATHFGFENTVYRTKFPFIKQRIEELGVRHIRDAAYLAECAPVASLQKCEMRDDARLGGAGGVYSRYRELAALGVKATLNVDPDGRPTLGPITPQKIARIERLAGPALEAFEGPNEHNKSKEGPLAGRRNPDWAEELTAWQRDLYDSVNDPSNTDYPVLGPAIGRPYPPEANPETGTLDLSDHLDFGSFHPYPGGRMPGQWGPDEYNTLRTARELAGTKPLIATEAGYTNALDYVPPPDGTGFKPVSEQAAGRYMPRLFLEHFNRGIVRTYAYELVDHLPEPNPARKIDPQKHFGLLRNDGTPKPAFTALENLIELLEEPNAPDFRPGSLDYALDDPGTAAAGDAPARIHHTLLQKSDETLYLILWQEVSSYDLEESNPLDRDTDNPDLAVTLELRKPMDEVNTYRPHDSTVPAPQGESVESLTLSVPDHPLVVEIKDTSAAVAYSSEGDSVLDFWRGIVRRLVGP